MLIPYGLEVLWDENGHDPQVDERGRIVLQVNQGCDSAQAASSSETRADAGVVVQQCSSGAAQSSSVQPLRFPFPLSMTPSESVWFSLVRRGEAATDGGQDGEDEDPPSVPSVGKREDATTQSSTVHGHGEEVVKETNNCADSAVLYGGCLKGSGVFFALKVQSARTKKKLDSLVKEVENLRLLSGVPGIVQLKDYAVDSESFCLIILMELGACDLHEFLKQNQYTLDAPSICSVWQTLVHRVESLHKSDIIHRDIKPHNFILAPVRGYRDAKILASTPVPREDFVYRLVRPNDREHETGGTEQGDVELIIKDPATGKEEVLLLTIKLTDFGIARPLASEASHLSVDGPSGTVVFMAPEAVRQTVTGSRKVSMRIDIWALGVMLYQMLHEGKTPAGYYMINGGPPEALLAVASETVNREAMDFDASNMWAVERTRLLLPSSGTGDHDPSEDDLPTTNADMVNALVTSWVASEFLVRVCKRCLAFDVEDRIDGVDLRVWIDRAIATGWGLRGGDDRVVSESELLQAAFNIDSSREEGSINMQTVDTEVARIGEKIGTSLFPEVWSCQNPKQEPTAPPSSTLAVTVRQGSSSSSPSASLPLPTKTHERSLDLKSKSPLNPHGDDSPSSEQPGDSFDRHQQGCSPRQVLVLILVSLIVGTFASLIVGAFLRGVFSGTDNADGVPSSFLGSAPAVPKADSAPASALLPMPAPASTSSSSTTVASPASKTGSPSASATIVPSLSPPASSSFPASSPSPAFLPRNAEGGESAGRGEEKRNSIIGDLPASSLTEEDPAAPSISSAPLAENESYCQICWPIGIGSVLDPEYKILQEQFRHKHKSVAGAASSPPPALQASPPLRRLSSSPAPAADAQQSEIANLFDHGFSGSGLSASPAEEEEKHRPKSDIFYI